MCSIEALATTHTEQENRTWPFKQPARHAPLAKEVYICEVKSRKALERVTRAQA